VDVLELTRPHAAKGEQVMWRVELGVTSSAGQSARDVAPTPKQHRAMATRPYRDARSALMWLGGLLAGLCLAALVWWKRRWLAARAESSEPRVAFLVPFPRRLRLPAIALGMMASVGLGLGLEQATLGCAALAVVMLLSIQHARPEKAPPRGPGRWQVVDADTVFAERPRLRGVGSLLEGSTGPGLFVFLLVTGLMSVFALRGMTVAPYRSAALAAAIAGLTPLFFTLGGARLLLPRRRLEPSALEPYFTLFSKRRLPVELIARQVDVADGAADEHRLRLLPPRPLAGFDSLELALEWHHGGWFLAVRPVFIARVREGSAAHQALPREARWSRGRHRDERVALIRPLASPSACLAKARELLGRLNQPVERSAKRRRRAPARLDRAPSRREVNAA
jgi:hypothetical protein